MTTSSDVAETEHPPSGDWDARAVAWRVEAGHLCIEIAESPYCAGYTLVGRAQSTVIGRFVAAPDWTTDVDDAVDELLADLRREEPAT
ncbi:MAG: hypothetical protein ACXIVQ_12120 [Acidimicrobiales bacterium]